MFRKSRISYCTRWISSGDGGEGNKLKIFDRELKRKHRDRAAYLMQDNDYFPNKVADNLLDRLRDCKTTFPTALCLGGCLQPIRRLLAEQEGIEKLLMMDMSHDMIKRCKDSQQSTSDQKFETLYIVGDEEFIPIKESSLDLIISCLGLHWVNDLPSTMIQCRRILKPDGLFLAALLGGETLRELRIACTVAQMEREGGVSPRISPFVHVRDAGNLLTGAGFAIPAIDVDSFTIRYRNALELIDHLRCMGESNSLLNRIPTMKKETALATAAIYQSLFGKEDGTVPATFQVIYMTGWAPHPSQQKAKRRGSATVSFEDIQKAFGTEETV